MRIQNTVMFHGESMVTWSPDFLAVNVHKGVYCVDLLINLKTASLKKHLAFL